MKAAIHVGVVLLALGLRAYPLHVAYIHPDQEAVPRMAVQSLLAGSWEPPTLVYPSGLMYTLRAGYGIAYGVAHLFGRVPDRAHFYAAFVDRPFSFVLLGRLWSCLLGVCTVVLLAELGRRLFEPRTGLVAALFLAVSFLHVRESHYGSLDAPATAFFTAALLAARLTQERGDLARAAAYGALVGVAVAHRYQAAAVALSLPIVEVLRVPRRSGPGVLRLLTAGVAALAVFALLSPYTLLDPMRAYADLADQAMVTYRWRGPPSLPLHTLLLAGAGPGMCALAIVGLLAALRRDTRASLPVVVPVAAYVATLLPAERLFARYTLLVLPPLALFAARGVAACAGLLPRAVAPLALGALAALVAVEPAARSLALDRLLAREDTRLAAARWVTEHVPSGALIAVNPTASVYARPPLPGPLDRAGGLSEAKPTYRFTSLEMSGTRQRERPRYALSIEHPGLPMFGVVPGEMRSFLQERARPLAEFVGLPDEAAGAAVFDPTDANYTPLLGFGAVERPGPNIRMWELVD